MYLQGYPNTKLLLSREADDFPIIDLTVSVSNMPCADMTKLPSRSLDSNYPLLDADFSGCGIDGKDRLHTYLIYKKKESEFYSDNGFNISEFSLPGFSDYIGNSSAYFIAKKKYQVKRNDACMNLQISRLNNME